MSVKDKEVLNSKALEPPFLAACHRKPTEKTPVWFMRQAGRYMPSYRRLREKYDLITLCKTPDLATEITLQPIKELGVDAAILFSDLLFPLNVLGVDFHFASGEGPVITTSIKSREDVARLQIEGVEEKLNFVFSAIRMVRKELNPSIPLIGFAGAPFTLASYMLEGGHSKNFLKTKQFMLEEPAAWHLLMSKIVTVISDYLCHQIDAGVDAVQLFDSWVGALAPHHYEHFVLSHSLKILEAAAKKNVPVIHFGTGNSSFLELFAHAGGDVISVDWRTPLDVAWRKIGPNKAIQGNLDPAALFAPLPVLKNEVESILKLANRRSGHIFNLGHGILPETPVDHVKAVIEWVKNW